MKENKSFKKRCIGVLAGKKVMAVVLSAVLCLSVSGTVWADLRTAIQLSGPGSYTIPDDLRDDQQHNLDKMSIYLHDGVSCIIKTNVLSITGTERNINIIIKSGGVVNGSVYGGKENNSTVSNNSVTIEGGTVTGSVYGGYSNNANNNNAISNNTVTLNGGSVQSNVYGGSSANGAVSNNTVTLKGGTVSGIVYGGSSNGDIINNTLHIAGKSLSVGGVMNFQNLKFTIPNDMTKSDTLLDIKGNENVNFQGMSIDTKNIKPGAMTNFKTGDRITLIHSNGGIRNVTYTGSSCTGPNGEVKCHFTNDQNNLYLVIDDLPRKEDPTRNSDDDIGNSSTSDDEPISRYTLKETAQAAPVTYTPGGNLTTTITTTNGGEDPFDLFRNAQLNGVTLTRGRHYTIRRGSLIISLLPEALKELPEGTNYLTVFFEDGDITIPFNLAELPEGNTKGAPKTGEI